MTLYMKIDPNYYELPLAVADSIQELAEILGIRKNTISRNMSAAKSGLCKARYIKVVCEDEEGDEE